MLFNSVDYIVFLLLAVGLHWVVPPRFRNAWLLACSYVFYGSWDVRFLALIGATTLVDFAAGLGIARANDAQRRKLILVASLIWNLGVLGFFKYYGFFVDSAVDVLTRLGLEASAPSLKIILPVGVSFFTFQEIGYTVACYRRKIEPTTNLVDYGVFVSFFPQLAAGPISTPMWLLPQIQARRTRPTPDVLGRGFALILLGLVKKVVMADLAAEVANKIYAQPGQTHWIGLIGGTLAFSVQIYFDFSAYTDIARGSARCFGIELKENFREPYLSRRPTEFWRRWHISLSEWLREHVYIPCGGSRRGRLFEFRNLMITMLVGGLWHGASWTFVAWGGYHGVLLVADRFVPGNRDGERPVVVRDIPAIAIMFGLTTLGWVFFRASSFGQVADVLGGIVRLQGGQLPVELVSLIPLAIGTLVYSLARRAYREHGSLTITRAPVAGALIGAAVVLIIVFSGAAPVPFVYFQF